MKNLRDLENNESILLMYLAGELAPEDHAEVEQMLTSDASLRQALASLQQAQQETSGALAELDRQTRPPVSQAFAEATVVHMIRQWQERRRRMSRTLVMPSRLMPRIVFGLATAASLIIGYFVWLAYHPSHTPTNSPAPTNDIADDEKVELMQNTMLVTESQTDTDMQFAETNIQFAAVMPGPDSLDSPADSSNQ